jgi:hypothetical protein
MFKNLFKSSKPIVLGRWSVDTATANTRAALANCDNCGTCTPYQSPPRSPKQPSMLVVGDDVIDLRGAMLAGAYYLPGRPVSDKNMRGSL